MFFSCPYITYSGGVLVKTVASQQEGSVFDPLSVWRLNDFAYQVPPTFQVTQQLLINMYCVVVHNVLKGSELGRKCNICF